MNVTVTITIQVGIRPEMQVFHCNVAPDHLCSTLAVARASVCATLAAIGDTDIIVREYLGPTLLRTIGPDWVTTRMAA